MRRLRRRAPKRTLYLKGRYFWNLRNESGLRRAIEYFEKAIEKDPNYALAHAGIADCYNVLGEHGYVPMSDALNQTRSFATKALDLDDSLAEAHASLAMALASSHEGVRSEHEFKKAIDLNPNYATAHHWYAVYLIGRGKKDESLSEAKLARELDPLSMQIRTFLAAAYYYAERFDDAQGELESCLELEPDFGPAHAWLAMVYAAKQLSEKAIPEAEKCMALMPGVRSKATFGYVNALGGRMEEAKKIYEELIQTSKSKYVSYLDLATLCTGLGRYEEAIDWLEKAKEHSELLSHILVAKWYAPLRSYKRYQDLLTLASS